MFADINPTTLLTTQKTDNQYYKLFFLSYSIISIYA